MSGFDAMRSLSDAGDALRACIADPRTRPALDRMAALLVGALKGGGKVLACGNGGSACDAMHFCEELTGRFRQDRPPLAAIACTDVGHITCTANDYGFDEVFARWVRGLGRRGDALVVLSTSGASPNIVRAVEAARSVGLATIALLGKGGGRLKGACDVELIVPGETSDRIQELHMLVLHTMVEAIESGLGVG